MSNPHQWSSFAQTPLAHRLRLVLAVALALAVVTLIVLFVVYGRSVPPS